VSDGNEFIKFLDDYALDFADELKKRKIKVSYKNRMHEGLHPQRKTILILQTKEVYV